MAGPLEQFAIKPIVPIEIAGADVSFTNSSLFMGIAIGCVFLLFHLAGRHATLVPGRLQSVVELVYEFVLGIIDDNAGKEGRKYFPIIITLFLFIIVGNLLGMIPGSFTYTSHIIVTFTLGAAVIIMVTAIGFQRHGLKFLTLFMPSGVPAYIYPILVPIEVLSYLVRPCSLAMRLAVNMTAGHIMLKTFAGFVVAMGVYGVLPLAAAVGLTGLEFVIALLQAYVFVVLTCVYLHDAIHLH